MDILLINGPNLNLLGIREPEIYGDLTLDQIEEELIQIAKKDSFKLNCYQSNHEGEIIDKIQNSIGIVDGILINAGALTHTSIALRDALVGSNIPFIELHISNVFNREDFRKKSYLTDKAIGIISGFGVYSYVLSLEAIINFLKN